MRTPLRLISLALAVAACLPASASGRSPVVTTEPGLRPGFTRAISDYTVRCPDRSLTITVRRLTGAEVTLDGRPYDEPRTVRMKPGKAIAIVVERDGRRTRHHVRCLPDDFPNWRFRHVGAPTPRWYVLTPSANFARPARPFVAIFDHRGVPVWWYRASGTDVVHNAGLIGGNIVYAEAGPLPFGTQSSAAYRIRRPDGALVFSVQTVGSPTDFHDFQRLGRDFLVLTYRPRPHVDLSAYGGPSDATVLDSEIQRIDRRGRLVWSWSSRDHIDLAETDRWWSFVLGTPRSLPDGTEVYDPTHINSVEPAGRDLIVSLRHTDAVYRIRMRDGRIRWKLGGTPTSRSLRVFGDPAEYPLSAQHDARLWRGTLTVHDNATGLDRPPRIVRYSIDTERRRATLRESLTGRGVTTSECCGSARKLANGNWLVGWGGLGISDLMTPRGRLIERLSIGGGYFSYRTVSTPARAVSAARLRAGMDAMYAAAKAD